MTRRSDVTAPGVILPAWALSVLIALLGSLLSAVAFSSSPLALASAALALLAAAIPKLPLTWGLIALLVAGTLTEGLPGPADLGFHLLLAGLPLLHLVASYAMFLPWGTRIQARSLAGTVRRYVVAQVVLQCAAAVALTVAHAS